MIYQHKELAQGRWAELSVSEQLANIGSEVSRALRWQEKKNLPYRDRAVYRALELIDLSLAQDQTLPRRRELARMRETLVDYFCEDNCYRSTADSWRKYFDHFAYYARKRYNEY
ncbi:MAG: hypothetical protein ACLFPX_00810 [Candidatus Omnitrophota bacterium]